MIVVAANVAAKWYLPEIGTEAALELLEGPNQLFAPDLICVEVLGSMTRCVRTAEAGTDETKKRCDDWLHHLGEGLISLIPERDLLDEALTLSLKIKYNLQDCFYLAAARRIDALLITSDKKFRKRAFPFYRRVTFLRGCDDN